MTKFAFFNYSVRLYFIYITHNRRETRYLVHKMISVNFRAEKCVAVPWPLGGAVLQRSQRSKALFCGGDSHISGQGSRGVAVLLYNTAVTHPAS